MMTNLGQVCLFSNLIKTPVQFFGPVSWEHLFLITDFKVVIYWWMIKISKLDTRRILKYLLNILICSLCEHSEYPGLAVNSNASFCFDRMECVDFFGLGD